MGPDLTPRNEENNMQNIEEDPEDGMQQEPEKQNLEGEQIK